MFYIYHHCSANITAKARKQGLLSLLVQEAIFPNDPLTLMLLVANLADTK